MLPCASLFTRVPLFINRPVKFSKIKYYLIIVALLYLHFPLGIFAETAKLDQNIKQQRSELQAFKKTLEQERKALKMLLMEKSSMLKKIDHITDNIEMTEIYLKKINVATKNLNHSISLENLQLKDIVKRIDTRNGILSKRVRHLYINGPPQGYMISGKLDGGRNIFKRAFFLKRFIDYDRSLIVKARKDESSKRHTLKILSEKGRELKRLLEQRKIEMATLNSQRQQSDEDIARLQNDEKLKRKALKELEDNAKLLGDIIKNLELKREQELAKKVEVKTLDRTTGACKPINGELISNFGHQYHSTLKTTTMNLGVEYLGGADRPVLSVLKGEVAAVSDIPGYGPGIIVYNGSGYYTIYANISGIKVHVGQNIQACEEIGRVSNSNLKAKRKIYFAVHKDRKPMNPVQWLKSMIN